MLYKAERTPMVIDQGKFVVRVAMPGLNIPGAVRDAKKAADPEAEATARGIRENRYRSACYACGTLR